MFPLTAELRAILEAQRAVTERVQKETGTIIRHVFFRAVFRGRGADRRLVVKPIKSIRRSWATACKAAGCPGMLRHDMRRSGVPNMVRDGVSERVCMALAGHKTRSVFERYNIVSETDLRDAAAKMDAAAEQRTVTTTVTKTVTKVRRQAGTQGK